MPQREVDRTLDLLIQFRKWLGGGRPWRPEGREGAVLSSGAQTRDGVEEFTGVEERAMVTLPGGR